MSKEYPDIGMYAVYIVQGLPFLPHYLKKGRYVAPGYRQNKLDYSAAQLKKAGAVKEYWPLWRRGRHESD